MIDTVKIVMPTGPKAKPVLDTHNRKVAGELSNKLMSAFDFAATEEGFEFWYSVVNRLGQLSTRGY